MVKPTEAHAFASETLAAHGLFQDGWRIKWNRMAGTAGVCYFGNKTIVLSALAVTRWDWPLVEDLVTHEIAHALTGPGHAHKKPWRDKVRSLGGVPAKHCPRFSTEGERFMTELASGANARFVLLCLVGAWFVYWPAGAVLTVATLLGVLAGDRRVKKDVIPASMIAQIERSVMRP